MTCKLHTSTANLTTKPMFFSHIIKPISFALASLLLASTSNASTPNVVVSIKPVHSLVSQISDNIFEPHLLLDKQLSAHHFQLKPSQIRQLKNADLFIYNSNNIESFARSLSESTDNLNIFKLDTIKQLKLLPHRGYDDHHHADSSPHTVDGHLWLSIENAKQISIQVTQQLTEMDKAHQLQYQKNLDSLLNKLDELKLESLLKLQPYSNRAMLVFHDAYQYFELEHQLQNIHFVTSSPEHSPGIKRIRELKQLIKQENIGCVFYEPPHIPPLIKTLVEDLEVKLVPLDPMGSLLSPGKEHYFELIRQTGNNIAQCLSATTKDDKNAK